MKISLVSMLMGLLLITSSNTFADNYYVILGSFSNRAAAIQELEKLNREIPGLTVIESERASNTLHRIALGPYPSSFEAEQKQLDFIQQGRAETWTMRHTGEVASDPIIAPVARPTIELTPRPQRRVSQQQAVTINRFVYQTPVLASEIEEILQPRTQKSLTSTEILETKEDINQLFVSHGYVNSGVLIPDQQINDGELALDFVPGKVTNIALQSELRDRYIENRLDITEPFNLFALQQSLKLLEQDPQVARIDAEVRPGMNPGEAAIDLVVETVSQLEVAVHAANDRSPSIGAENAEAAVTARNLTGWGETYRVSTSVTEGLDAQSAYFHLPLTARGASLELKYALSNSSVIEEPFDNLDVDSQTESSSLILTYPVYRALSTHIDAQLTLEVRRNETELLGQAFSFSEGAINGESKVAPIRLAISYLRQNMDDSLAARVSVSRGTSHFDASDATNQANGIFTSYLGQIQYSRRLTEQSHLTLKALSQYASDPLLTVEKFALGGLGSVRGYRQNQVVRDNAVLLSAEYHYRLDLPISLTLMTFAEWGKGENHDDATLTGSEDLGSIGVGAILLDWHGLTAELYLARAFDDFASREYDLTDDGIHFRLGYRYAF